MWVAGLTHTEHTGEWVTVGFGGITEAQQLLREDKEALSPLRTEFL